MPPFNIGQMTPQQIQQIIAAIGTKSQLPPGVLPQANQDALALLPGSNAARDVNWSTLPGGAAEVKNALASYALLPSMSEWMQQNTTNPADLYSGSGASDFLNQFFGSGGGRPATIPPPVGMPNFQTPEEQSSWVASHPNEMAAYNAQATNQPPRQMQSLGPAVPVTTAMVDPTQAGATKVQPKISGYGGQGANASTGGNVSTGGGVVPTGGADTSQMKSAATDILGQVQNPGQGVTDPNAKLNTIESHVLDKLTGFTPSTGPEYTGAGTVTAEYGGTDPRTTRFESGQSMAAPNVATDLQSFKTGAEGLDPMALINQLAAGNQGMRDQILSAITAGGTPGANVDTNAIMNAQKATFQDSLNQALETARGRTAEQGFGRGSITERAVSKELGRAGNEGAANLAQLQGGLGLDLAKLQEQSRATNLDAMLKSSNLGSMSGGDISSIIDSITGANLGAGNLSLAERTARNADTVGANRAQTERIGTEGDIYNKGTAAQTEQFGAETERGKATADVALESRGLDQALQKQLADQGLEGSGQQLEALKSAAGLEGSLTATAADREKNINAHLDTIAGNNNEQRKIALDAMRDGGMLDNQRRELENNLFLGREQNANAAAGIRNDYEKILADKELGQGDLKQRAGELAAKIIDSQANAQAVFQDLQLRAQAGDMQAQQFMIELMTNQEMQRYLANKNQTAAIVGGVTGLVGDVVGAAWPGGGEKKKP